MAEDKSKLSPLYPQVHRNGTSPEALLNGAVEVARALSEALDLMNKHQPNARDFYVLGDGVASQAIREHCARYDTVYSVLRYYRDMADDIDRQGTGRL